jgi:transposase
MLTDGFTYAQVASELGVGLRTVAGWSARLRVGGFEGLGERRRGRRAGEQMAISYADQERVVGWMMGTNPDQLQVGHGVLWDRAAVRELVALKLGIRLTVQSIGQYLKRWGWTAKKPMKRWLEQDPERVKAWLGREYPAIVERARREDARILWADEMGVRTGQTAGLSYAPVGQRAVVAVTGKRYSVNVISAIGNDGTLLFDVLQGNTNETVFIAFCEKLIAHHSQQKVFLIVDNAKFHKSNAVREWQAAHTDQITLFFLPPYAPEYNPDEYLNNDVHAHVARRRPRTLSDLTQMTIRYLCSRTPEIVRNYFAAPFVRYAQ